MEVVFSLYYCNPAELVGNFRTLENAKSVISREYCQYIVQCDIRDGKRVSSEVVWSTARDNPRFKVGYRW